MNSPINFGKAGLWGLLLFFVIGCRSYAPRIEQNVQEKNTSITPFKKGCDPSISLPWNEKYTIINNQWGKDKVKKGNVNICTYLFSTKSDSLFGWEFQMPQKSYGVVAYPEIYYGALQWDIQPTTHCIIQIKDIQTLYIDYSAVLQSNGGKMNLATDLWILDQPMASRDAIRTELMVWEYAHHFKPNGKKIAEIRTTEGIYELRIGTINRKKLGLKWQYIAFIRKENRTAGKIPLQELIAYLVAQNHIPSTHYISAIEMGTELSNASGSIFFTQYDLVVQ